MTTSDLAARVADAGERAVARPTMAAVLDSMQGQFARALPTHIAPERFIRIALTAVRQNPALGRCSPESFLGALLTCAQLGLEPNTPAGEAYLIPYGDVCTFVPGYRGLAKLAWQSGSIDELYVEVVRENDEFRYELGLHRDLVHRPNLDVDRGPVIGAYAVVKLKGGGIAFDYWTLEQIRLHQQAHSNKRSAKAPADLAGWMDRKVVLKQVLKLVPSSPEMHAALANDGAVRTDLTFNALDVVEGEADEVTDAELVDEATGEVPSS